MNDSQNGGARVVRFIHTSDWQIGMKGSGHPWDLADWIDAYPEIHSPSSVVGEGRGEGAGIPLLAFRWDEDRRAVLRAELDAYYTVLCGLTQKELRYILDPKDIYREDFPSESFPVLKEKV